MLEITPQYMTYGKRVVKLPNPHKSAIGEGLLKKLLEQADVSHEQWLIGKPLDEDK